MRVDTAGHHWITTRELQETMYGSKVPEIEQWRRYFGKAVNTAVIEEVLCSAAMGHMRDVTDLSYEMLKVDPHLATTVTKRMRAVGSIQPKVKPAEGEGLDPELAKFYADMVRSQLTRIPRLRQRIINLAWGAYHGRSALEVEWTEATGNTRQRWRVKALHWLHPRRLSLGPEREVRVRDDIFQGRGFEAVGFDLRELPFKFIVSQRQLFNEYPEREGLAQACFYYSYFKRLGWRERLALMELYGKPWRWVEVMPDAVVGEPDLLKARDAADDMGGNAAGAFPAGVKMNTSSVGPNAGQIHKEILDDCNSELSKLVLGSTNTTDAGPDGLGGEQARVHQDGETLVFTTDCAEIGEDLTRSLAHSIVLLNAGPEAAELYTPTIELPYELPPDPTVELERADKALNLGLKLKRSEVYAKSGYSEPTEEDDVLERAAPAADPLAGFGLAGQPKLSVNPSDTSNQEREIQRSGTTLRFTNWRPGRVYLASAATTKTTVQGIPIEIDRPKGFVQSGIDADGNEWERTYQVDYGFIPRTEGGDGEALDVFLGPNPESSTVYWVKQRRESEGGGWEFDEYKLFIGFDSATDALDTYQAHVPTKYFAGLDDMSIDQVKALLGLDPAVQLHNLAVERATRVLAVVDLLKDQVRG